MDLFEVGVDGGVGGVHDEEREGQVQQEERQRVGDVASEHRREGNNGVRRQFGHMTRQLRHALNAF